MNETHASIGVVVTAHFTVVRKAATTVVRKGAGTPQRRSGVRDKSLANVEEV